MPEATANVTLTINKDTKAFSLSDKIALYEQITVNIAASNGDTWPAGSYMLAVTYYGRTMALAACTYDAGELSCALNLATEEMEDIFSLLRNPKRVQLDLTLWDNTSKKKWATGKVDVWFTEYTTASAAPVPVPNTYYNGSTAITNGSNSVTVSLGAYSLSAAPSQVFLSVRGASGEDNVTVLDYTGTASALTVRLSAPVQSSNYVLNWLFFPA